MNKAIILLSALLALPVCTCASARDESARANERGEAGPAARAAGPITLAEITIVGVPCNACEL
jgi:hypothetical protein